MHEGGGDCGGIGGGGAEGEEGGTPGGRAGGRPQTKGLFWLQLASFHWPHFAPLKCTEAQSSHAEFGSYVAQLR